MAMGGSQQIPEEAQNTSAKCSLFNYSENVRAAGSGFGFFGLLFGFLFCLPFCFRFRLAATGEIDAKPQYSKQPADRYLPFEPFDVFHLKAHINRHSEQ